MHDLDEEKSNYFQCGASETRNYYALPHMIVSLTPLLIFVGK